jgi:hypothetical protein
MSSKVFRSGSQGFSCPDGYPYIDEWGVDTSPALNNVGQYWAGIACEWSELGTPCAITVTNFYSLTETATYTPFVLCGLSNTAAPGRVHS